MLHIDVIIHQSEITGAFFCGAMALLAFFVAILYIKNKERIYLYYALFLLFSLAYGFTNIRTATWVGEIFGGYFQGNRRFIEPFTLLAFASYIAFAMELLDIQQQSRRVARVFSAWTLTCAAYAVAYGIFYDFIAPFALSIFVWVRVIIFSLSAYLLVWIMRRTASPLKIPFLLGSYAYFVGSFLASARFAFEGLPFPALYRVSATSIFEMGILVETLFFALALGQRIVLLTREREWAQQQHLERISEKGRLVSEQKEELERRIKAREEAVVKVQERLASEEKMRLKAEFETELARSETIARSLEINPHFLHNCLNSIMYLIQSDQNKKAVEYLTVFSRFMRLVLETSRKRAISVVEELTMIEKYLKLERNRFGQDFSYRVNGANQTMMGGVMVPPMLLYPVVENAVWHGAMSSPDVNKEITIDVGLQARQLTIRIADNGVGWISGQRKSQRSEPKALTGISLTRERIKLFNHSFDDKIDFRIDEVNDGERTGTEAIFVITLSER